jgi:H+/Cl- antiporter ClcA
MRGVAAAAKRLSRLALDHRYGFLLLVMVAAAGLTGLACVWFMWGFDGVLTHRIGGHWRWLATPALFVLSVELIRRFAPCAAGPGIPQAIFAARHLSPETEKRLAPLTSITTMAVKILALYLGLWAGASTGREGPTVHVATCVFIGLILLVRRLSGIKIDLRSAVVAGGAAGLAAAFNTPLAGVTFAIEELAGDYFGSMKDYVIMAIIFAAITAKALTGEYTYFGRLAEPAAIPLTAILLIGALGGLLGAFFSTALIEGQKALAKHHRAHRYAVPALMALGLLVVARFSAADVLGPGNAAAQTLVRGDFAPWAWAYPVEKLAATLCTFWSGIAGGIFAPCLAVGAALGADVAQWMSIPIASCALVGMAAFLSGTIQAPITAFVIIFEMTGHHQMLLPVMLGSLLGFMVAKLTGASHLYQALCVNYNSLLGDIEERSETPAIS